MVASISIRFDDLESTGPNTLVKMRFTITFALDFTNPNVSLKSVSRPYVK